MTDLLTINPRSAAAAIGLAIDLAVIENTKRKNPSIDMEKVIAMMNKFTTCNKIVITYGGVDNDYTFKTQEELKYNLSVILRWIIDKEAYVANFHENGFSCMCDGCSFRMSYYD